MYTSKKLAVRLTKAMINNEVIPEAQEELYSYCYEYLFEQILYISIMFVLALVFHKVIIFAIFLATFLPMRAYGGGFHAPNDTMCTILSFALYLLVLFFIPIIATKYKFPCLVVFITVIPIDLYIVPIDTPNKRFKKKERIIMKKKFSIVCFFLLLMYFLFYYTNMKICYISLSICVILASISLFFGLLENHIQIYFNRIKTRGN